MEAGLMTLNTLPPEKQEDVLRALFDPKTGAGFTAMKTPLAGTDFQSAGPWFTYDDTPGDIDLKNFSVDRDFAPTASAPTSSAPANTAISPCKPRSTTRPTGCSTT